MSNSTKVDKSTTAQLYFGDSSSENDDIFDPTSDASSLPFPKPLDRSSFLTPAFSAADFLSTLTTRFQTLEDLQSELHDLLRSLNKELVDLVNDNYTSFLALGQKLSGGEERIEEVRVGLLGFQRDVGGLRDLVDARSEAVRVLLEQKKELRKEIQRGRILLELDERLLDLERRLRLTSRNIEFHVSQSNNDEDDEQEALGDFEDWDEDWSRNDTGSILSDEDDEVHDTLADPTDLPWTIRKSTEQFLIVQQIARTNGLWSPFVLAQTERMNVISNVLRKDLENAIRAQSDVKTKQRIIQLKAQLDDHE